VSPAKRARSGRVARELEPKQLTDPKEMRALAHPVRIALLEVLAREGPLTATEAGELVDESPANCSFHLRTLAKYGFVEEAEGATGRNRPWQRVSIGNSFSAVQPDAESTIAAHELGALFQGRTYERLRRWSATQHQYDPVWQEAAFMCDTITYLTAEELEAVGRELRERLEPYRERSIDRDKRPADAKPVSIALFGHPVEPTPSGN
jgi:DNA-binding transcriptional ArsR family regulator